MFKFRKFYRNSDTNDGFRIPAFIPKIYRFSCGAAECNYITHDSVGLKKHFETLHAELEKFSCPHCGSKMPLAKINVHFRYHNTKLFQCGYCNFLHYQSTRIEDHQREKHPGNEILVVKLRALETDENMENEIRFPAFKTDENIVSSSVRWRCNLCKHSPLPLENLMKSHCQSSHGVANQYKCSMCSFSADEEEIVASHLKSSHSGSSQIIVNIYKKINPEESSNTSNSSSVPDVKPSKKRQSCELPNMPALSDSSTPSITAVGLEKEQLIERKTSTEKTNSAAITDKVTSEEEQDDRNNLLVSPYSAVLYRCPLCDDFRTPFENKMRDHIFSEQKYSKYVCTACGKTGVSRQELEPHLVEERITHPRTNHDYFETFTVDETLESRVQRALDHQTSLMKQMTQQHLSENHVIEISDDEDEEKVDLSSPASNSDSTGRNSESNLVSSVRCKTNIVQSPRGSAQWASNPSVSPKTSPRSVAPPLPCIINTTTIERPSMSVTCPTCNAVFSTVTAVQAHFSHCGQQSSAEDQSVASSNASNQSYSIATDSRRRSSAEHQQTMSSKHVSNKSTKGPNEGRRQSFPQCQSTPNIDPAPNRSVSGASEVTRQLSTEQSTLNRVLNQSSSATSEGSCQLMGESSQAAVLSAVSGYCDICGPIGQPMSAYKLDMHRRQKHEPFTCIRCCGQFSGEDRLVDHIHTVEGLSGTDQQNSACVPVANPNVRILCSYCPYGERGNDYQTYVSLVRHIRSLHPGSVSIASRCEEGEIEVQVQSGKCRPLTSSEISLMLMQSNSNLPGSEGTDGVGAAAAIERAPPVKRRRVAIKSTARPTASQPIQKVVSKSPSESELQHL